MEAWKRCLYVIAMMFIIIVIDGEGQLTENYYSSTCPTVESIVTQAVSAKFNQTFTTIPATLRLFFHDCFVEGCDASIMIASANGDAEKDFVVNLSLAGDGFDTVIKAKQAVESSCPGIVSCADILALAARDVIVLAGGPTYNVELGRLDGLISQSARVSGNLPDPNSNLAQLNSNFARHNLSQIDLIALTGAHTIGFSHCGAFSNRLYSFSSSTPLDPSLDPDYAVQLMAACPKDVDPAVAVNMDPLTPRIFDNGFYQNLVKSKGLFTSDQVLFTDVKSQATINDFANSLSAFYQALITAMTKLGRVGIKNGDAGEIRTDCTAFNS